MGHGIVGALLCAIPAWYGARFVLLPLAVIARRSRASELLLVLLSFWIVVGAARVGYCALTPAIWRELPLLEQTRAEVLVDQGLLDLSWQHCLHARLDRDEFEAFADRLGLSCTHAGEAIACSREDGPCNSIEAKWSDGVARAGEYSDMFCEGAPDCE